MFTRFLFFEVLIELLPVWGHALAVAAPRRKELDEGQAALLGRLLQVVLGQELVVFDSSGGIVLCILLGDKPLVQELFQTETIIYIRFLSFFYLKLG